MYYSISYIPCQYLFKVFRKFFCNFSALRLRFICVFQRLKTSIL
nr:MAG TPA: hypothetical protein [Caudoviricetes sp.]